MIVDIHLPQTAHRVSECASWRMRQLRLKKHQVGAHLAPGRVLLKGIATAMRTVVYNRGLKWGPTVGADSPPPTRPRDVHGAAITDEHSVAGGHIRLNDVPSHLQARSVCSLREVDV